MVQPGCPRLRPSPMQPRSQRRVHSAEFKAQVLAECQQPGACVAAIALAHGLNVNLLREWLVGHGIKRTGLAAPRTVTRKAPAAVVPAAAPLQFIPLEVAPAVAADAAPAEAAAASLPDIHIELSRGAAQLCVRQPRLRTGSRWRHQTLTLGQPRSGPLWAVLGRLGQHALRQGPPRPVPADVGTLRRPHASGMALQVCLTRPNSRPQGQPA
ncbi:MAG: transposase [Burkholderiales bacterium]|nr:transposase [Burkholderiales bacterium]